MPKLKNQSAVNRIRNQYNSLPPAERKLADLLLDFPGDIASYSATELSNLAGVSKAATTRFFQRLGYESFEQARRQARDQQVWGSPLYMMSQNPTLQIAESSLKRQMELELQNMVRTYDRLDITYLENIAGKLIKAPRIWVLGFRHSYYLAGYTRWQMLQIRGQVHLLDTEDATLAEQIVDIEAEDVVIAIGFRRRMKLFLETLKALHTRKLRILYLTDPNVGASINYATWVLTADVSGAGTFDSYPAATSLIHLLCSSMFTQCGRSSRDRFKQIEDLHETLNDF